MLFKLPSDVVQTRLATSKKKRELANFQFLYLTPISVSYKKLQLPFETMCIPISKKRRHLAKLQFMYPNKLLIIILIP
jgi:hypothetical protein